MKLKGDVYMLITKEVIHEMVLNHKEVAEPQLKELFESEKETLKKVELDNELEDVLGKLVYPNLDVLGNDKTYFLFKDEKMVYHGLVDREGLIDTIKNDIESAPTFMSVNILIHDANEDKLYEMLSDAGTLIKYSGELMVSFAKGQENGHY